MGALDLIKPAVRDQPPYTLAALESVRKLNQNESPYDVPDELKERIARRLQDRPWNRYPPFVARDFISAVAEATGWPDDGVLVANGSNELIQAVLAVTVSAGTHVVVPEPKVATWLPTTAPAVRRLIVQSGVDCLVIRNPDLEKTFVLYK